MKKLKCGKLNNAGFTLVELVVVLLLMAILLGTALLAGLGWQDWAQFRHEEACAEDIFYAAQNQLTELDSSGALYRKVTRPLMNSETEGDYKSSYLIPNFEDVIYKKNGDQDEHYDEDLIWINTNKDKHPGKLVRLRANANDFDKYLNNELGENEDAKILFDLITPYIQDKSVLNGSIIIEFSPDAGQVFSVLYSDKADSLVYGPGSVSGDKKSVSVMNRILQIRQDNMLGYFSVDNLTYKVKGRGTVNADLKLKIENNELFSLVVIDDNAELKSGDVLSFNVYDGSKSGDNVIMTFNVNYDEIVFASDKKSGLDNAIKNPVLVDVIFPGGSGLYGKNKTSDTAVQFRIPIFADSQKETKGNIYVVLDAADVQAQTLAYSQSIYFKDNNSNGSGQINTFVDMEEAFRNTYTFYRFGLSNNIDYIYADVKKCEYDNAGNPLAESDPIDSFSEDENSLHRNQTVPKGECVAFASHTKEDSGENIYEIENMRHFYNIRYETDYKTDPDKENTFKIMNDLSWKDFVGKGSDSDVNYFVNSRDPSTDNITRVIAGLDLSGSNYGVEGGDTAEYSFPGFRKLDKNDKLTQKAGYGGEEKNYVISDLKITITGNIAYGIYGNDIRQSCKNNNFSNTQGIDDTSKVDSSGARAARAGKMPLGLFAENLGTIENITLNRHIVNGLEKHGNDIVYTCMVGGFAGNNLGTISNLTLLSNTNTKNQQNWDNYKKDASKVNGRTDVGGIIGRQSFSVDVAKRDVTIKGMTSYANVTGLENVGGIVGRAYTRYVDGTNVPENESTFTKYYSNTVYENSALTSYQGITQRYYNCHDGYDITDNYKSMTGESVVRNDKITIEDCHNRGIVSGDSIAYSDMIGKQLTTWKETEFVDESITACSFIGGIAGSAIDGMIIDDKNLKSGGKFIIKAKCNDFLSGTNAYITVKKSDSYPTYEKMEADDIASVSSNKSLLYDNYVGGLIGYSKLVAIENCNNKPLSQYDIENDGVPNLYIFGNRYVGGLIGCSTATRFDKGDAAVSLDGVAEKTYAATNYSNVFGRLYVGGIMGGNGIGDDDAETFDYRNPSLNEASPVSQIRDGNYLDVTHNILNTGAVLCTKNNFTTFDPLVVKSGNSIKEDSRYSQGYTGYCGGIVGINRMTFNNCDNIQSEAVKGYVMSLISDSTSLYTKDMNGLNKHLSDIDTCKLGGYFVGGILGYNVELGFVNYDDSSCYVDAIVYGQQYVGGGVGGAYNNNKDNECLVKNIYFDKKSGSSGSYIIGGDVVGGVAGRLESIVKNQKAIDKPFTVFGRYAVGGMLGIVNTSSTRDNISIDMSSNSDKVYVFGKGYTGGVVGYQSGDSMRIDGATEADVDLDDIHVEGKYFTGGIVGRAGDISRYHKLESVKNIKMGDNVSVSSHIFAGGIAGLYYFTKNKAADFYSFTGQPYKLVNQLCGEDLSNTYTNVVIADINNGPIFGKLDGAKCNIEFEDYGKTNSYTNKADVTADLFAGGLFGYLPDATDVTIKGFVNSGSIKVNRSIKATVDVSTEGDTSYSFIGGVVGRVPYRTTLINCSNISTGDNYSSKGTYIGGLTEVNAGTISGDSDSNGDYDYLINNTSYEYIDQNVGAFAGVNGTTHEHCEGVIQYVQNRGNISSGIGTASGIAATENGASKITNCINLGDISSTSLKAAGICATPSGQDEISLCRNYGTISGTSKYGIAGGKVGTLSKNLECSGLNEENGGTPIATIDNDHHMNFYVYGTDSTLTGEWYQIDFSSYLDKGIGGTTYYSMLKDNRGGPEWKMTTIYDTSRQNNEIYLYIHNNHSWIETDVLGHFGNDSEKFMQYSSLVYAAFRTIRANQGVDVTADNMDIFEDYLNFYKYVYKNGKILDDLYSSGYVEDSLSIIGGSETSTKEFVDSISEEYKSKVWANCPSWVLGGSCTYAELYSSNSGYGLHWKLEDYRNGNITSEPTYPGIKELAMSSYGFNGNKDAFHAYIGKLYAYYILEVYKGEPFDNSDNEKVMGFVAFVNEQITKDTKDITPQPSGGGVVGENHWPLQLNSASSGTTWKLTFRKPSGVVDTGITELSANPITYPTTIPTRVSTYIDGGLDGKFVTMANTTVATDYISE